MKIFFNSSMPRSCSTLMQNILGNNPDFHATPTSGLLEMLNASKRVYTLSPVMKAQDELEMKKAFLTYCRYALQGFYEGITDKKYVIDKSRGWSINSPFLESFYPNPKIICVVRDLRDIVASMEKNYRKNPLLWDPSLDEKEPKGTSVSQRITLWMNHKSKPVGDTLTKLNEVIFRNLDKNILFVKSEELLANPDKEMRRVYDYLEIPYYKIDYDNVKQVTYEDDKFHGRYGDHKIKSKISPHTSNYKEVIGEYIGDQIYEKNKWYFDYFNYKK